MKRFGIAFLGMRKTGVLSLLIGLPVIISELIYVLCKLILATPRELVTLVHTFPTMMQDILLSLVLIIGGSLLFDLLEREKEERE